jgi:hypothetical protein
MGQAKAQYIEWLESQISDADWAEYERYLDEQDKAWWQQQEAAYRASLARQASTIVDYEAELQLLQDAREDEEFWRRGQW